MSLRVTEDEAARGGFAFLDLGRKIARAPLKLSIRRLDVEPRHLGLESWQPEIAWIDPESVDNAGATTIVRIGPVIIDKIEEFVPVEIFVQGDGRIGQMAWPFVTPSPQSLTGIRIQSADPSESEAQLVETAEPVNAPLPPPLRDPEPIKPVEPAKQVSSDDVTPPAKAGRGKWIWLIVLILLAGGSYFAWPHVQQMMAERQRPEPRPIVVPDPGPPPPVLPTAAELQSRYDALIRRNAPANEFVELGIAAIAAGHGAVAFRAFEWAGPEASPDAAWHLGQFYDPRVTEPVFRNAAAPNVRRAAEYYSLWKSRSPRHATELRSLCAASGAAMSSDARLTALCR